MGLRCNQRFVDLLGACLARVYLQVGPYLPGETSPHAEPQFLDGRCLQMLAAQSILPGGISSHTCP